MVTGNRNILNSIKGITSVVKLTAEEKTALADRVLPANVLVVDSSNIVYLTDGVTAVKALNPLLASSNNYAYDKDVVHLTGDETIAGTKTFSAAIVGSVTGNAGSATKLATARTINGTSFNGTTNITTANWGTARNISITDGTNTSTAVSVNGSANVALNLPATIKANLTGNAATATKATQDSAGQQIDTTYIKGLAVSGRTITYTKGDNTTGTITTQDTNTWTAFKGATSSANGTAGYVPAPTKGNQDKFFKADGTWATPTNTTYSFSNSAPTLAWGKTSTIGTVGGVDLTVTMPANPNTDTHWTTTIYAGAKDAKSNAVTTNGNSYIKLFDNNTVRSQLNIRGSGATTVTTDANGVITINSTDNNTTYSNMKGATDSTAGTAGLVPAPAAGTQAKYLRGDGTWQVPPNTTYASMSASEATTGTATAARTISAKVLHDKINSNLSAYATKTELNNGLATKANNSEVVHKSGDETIAGAKSFTSDVEFTSVTNDYITGLFAE